MIVRQGARIRHDIYDEPATHVRARDVRGLVCDEAILGVDRGAEVEQQVTDKIHVDEEVEEEPRPPEHLHENRTGLAQNSQAGPAV